MRARSILGLVGLIFVLSCIFFYGYSLNKLNLAEKRIAQMANRPVANPAQVVPPSYPETPNEPPSILRGLPEEDRGVLLASFPFSEHTYQQVRQLSPGLFIALIGQAGHGSAWLLDVQKKRATSLTDELEMDGGNYVWLKEWVNGVAIEMQSSPGEAVAGIHTIYVDTSGKIVADTEYGDYGRQGNMMDARIQNVRLSAELLQQGSCLLRVSGLGVDSAELPKTVLVGIRLNGKIFSLPAPINVSCEHAYGDGIANPLFPKPYFDGNDIVFRLPGYDVSLKVDGRVVYTPRMAYKITCGVDHFVMTKEDAAGEHGVADDFLNSPQFKDQIKNYEVACLRVIAFDENIFHFLLEGFDEVRREYFPRATFDYDTRTRTVSRLHSLPHLSYDSNKGALFPLPCGSEFAVYLAEVRQNNSQHLALFERCARARQYPFRTYPIPGSVDSYFGFMGNEYSQSPPHAEGPVCIIDGWPQGCLFYRVKDGELTTLATSDDMSQGLIQVQPFAAHNANSAVIQHLPYEICYSTWYELFDFGQNTSTAPLLDYHIAGSCGEETALVFYPARARSVKVVLDTSKMSSENKIELFFEGKSIGVLTSVGVRDWSYGAFFPQEKDLAVYAQQADRRIFSFSIGDKRFRLNLMGDRPVLE